MKFLSFSHNGKNYAGILDKEEVVALRLADGTALNDVGELLRLVPAERLIEIKSYSEIDRFPLTEIIFRPLIPNPGKILCIGINYEGHRVETGRDKSAYPAVFTRFADSLVGHQQPLIRPRASVKYDYEGELAVIIGKAGRAIPEDRAFDYIAGFSGFMDGSIRDWQNHTAQFTPGKNFPKTGSFGPYLVTPEEFTDWPERSLETRLNGTIMQQTRFADMIFSIPKLIAYVSSFTELAPGDMIATGTPAGVGVRRQPPVYLKAGDRLDVIIEGIGTLANPVADETIAASGGAC